MRQPVDDWWQETRSRNQHDSEDDADFCEECSLVRTKRLVPPAQKAVSYSPQIHKPPFFYLDVFKHLSIKMSTNLSMKGYY